MYRNATIPASATGWFKAFRVAAKQMNSSCGVAAIGRSNAEFASTPICRCHGQGRPSLRFSGIRIPGIGKASHPQC